jgi:hypothetical protein
MERVGEMRVCGVAGSLYQAYVAYDENWPNRCVVLDGAWPSSYFLALRGFARRARKIVTIKQYVLRRAGRC